MILGTRASVLGTTPLGAVTPQQGTAVTGSTTPPVSVDLPELALQPTVVLGSAGGLT